MVKLAMAKKTQKTLNRSVRKKIPKSFQFRTRIAVIVAIVISIGIGYIGFHRGHGPIAAAQPQICAQYGSGYCINDWNNGGDGNGVKMYRGGVSNENFHLLATDPCHSGGRVTHTCPFSNHDIDNLYYNGQTVMVEYYGNYQCVGTITGGYNFGAGILTPCGDGYANGAGNGAIFVWVHSSATTGTLINRYWTNKNNPTTSQNYYLYYLCSGGSQGGPVWTDGLANVNDSGDVPASCYWGGL